MDVAAVVDEGNEEILLVEQQNQEVCRLCGVVKSEIPEFCPQEVYQVYQAVGDFFGIEVEPENGICHNCVRFVKKIQDFQEHCLKVNTMFSMAALSNVQMGSMSTDWEEVRAECDIDHFSWKSIDSTDIAAFSDDPLPDFVITPRHIMDSRVEVEQEEDEINFLNDLGEGIEFLEGRTSVPVPSTDPQKEETFISQEPTPPPLANTVQGKPKFECKECGKFLSRTSFQTHKQYHLGGATNKCKICDKNFSRSDVLRNHQLTHSSERKFRCDDCQKTFYRAADLRSHQRIHDDAKPYSCPECGKQFKRLGDLRSHNLTHERKGDFCCTQCNKKFLSMGGLKYHYKVHSGEKPYDCPKCDQKFRQSANLTKHIRKAHA